MHAYSDSDWATCPVTRRSISGTVVFMCGAPVSWMSRRQQIVATSSIEAEYIAAYYAAQKSSGSEPCLVTSISKIPMYPPPCSSTMNRLAPWLTTQFIMLGPSTSMSSSTGSVNMF
jgi:hypothetical protein